MQILDNQGVAGPCDIDRRAYRLPFDSVDGELFCSNGWCKVSGLHRLHAEINRPALLLEGFCEWLHHSHRVASAAAVSPERDTFCLDLLHLSREDLVKRFIRVSPNLHVQDPNSRLNDR